MTNKKNVKKRKKVEKNSSSIWRFVMILLGTIVIVLMYDMLFGISFSTTNYQTPSKIELEIPKLMDVTKSDDKKIELKTVRSMAAISKDMKKIRKNYETISCEKEEFYYQENQDVSISYKIKRGLIFNYLTINYQKGKPVCRTNEEETTSNCRFTRTYVVDLVKPMNTEEKIYVTLSEYQNETETIELPSIWKDALLVGHTYEFTFEQLGAKTARDEKISSIFSSYVVVGIEETTLQGMGQKQEAICK